MPGPSITVNTYGGVTGHTNVTFRDATGNHIGTWGANIDIGSAGIQVGGIYAESSSRPTTYTHQIILPDAAFNNALHYARDAASATARGAGQYALFLANCYDFVEAVLKKMQMSRHQLTRSWTQLP